MAGAVMWVVGDLVFLTAILGIVVGWMRREERESHAADAREDAARAAIRERETRLAERLARERGETLTLARPPGRVDQPANRPAARGSDRDRRCRR